MNQHSVTGNFDATCHNYIFKTMFETKNIINIIIFLQIFKCNSYLSLIYNKTNVFSYTLKQ